MVFVHTELNVKTVLFQTIQFSVSSQITYQNSSIQVVHFTVITHFSFIWPIDRTLSRANTPDQSGPGSDLNEGILYIPQNSSITGTSPSDCLVS